MRGRITNKKTGPKNPRSTVLTTSEEQVICEFRRLTKFSLDDVFISLKKRNFGADTLEFTPLFEAS